MDEEMLIALGLLQADSRATLSRLTKWFDCDTILSHEETASRRTKDRFTEVAYPYAA